MPDMTPTVFVVDDDASFCRAVERLLNSFGHRVETFASPTEFVNRLRPEEPGCVLLDMRMPELPGLEVQRLVTASGFAMPIIFVSGSADVECGEKHTCTGTFEALTGASCHFFASSSCLNPPGLANAASNACL